MVVSRVWLPEALIVCVLGLNTNLSKNLSSQRHIVWQVSNDLKPISNLSHCNCVQIFVNEVSIFARVGGVPETRQDPVNFSDQHFSNQNFGYIIYSFWSVGTFGDNLRIWDRLGPFWTILDRFEPYWTLSNHLEPVSTILDYFVPF